MPYPEFAFNTTYGAWAYNTPPFSTDGNMTGYNHAIYDNHIKIFECPSDGGLYNAVTGGIWDAYWQNGYTLWGDYLYETPGFGKDLGRTNYIANAGYIGSGGPYCGPYYVNSSTKTTQIVDGTSQTIGFGETLGGTSSGQRDFVMSWGGSGSMPTAWGLPLDGQGDWYQYNSMHSGYVQFGFCDGSVRAFMKGCNFSNYIYASGMNDNQVINWALLGNAS